jgi:hypothetical protein
MYSESGQKKALLLMGHPPEGVIFGLSVLLRENAPPQQYKVQARDVVPMA